MCNGTRYYTLTPFETSYASVVGQNLNIHCTLEHYQKVIFTLRVSPFTPVGILISVLIPPISTDRLNNANNALTKLLRWSEKFLTRAVDRTAFLTIILQDAACCMALQAILYLPVFRIVHAMNRLRPVMWAFKWIKRSWANKSKLARILCNSMLEEYLVASWICWNVV